MTTKAATRNVNRVTSFDDLKGLRAECYVRDSTLDQSNGFGPDIQHRNEERFAGNYGLILGRRWYQEFVSGRSAKNRHEFQKVIEDARSDLFDVLLVDHTSRFGRNQAECIRYKEELQNLSKTVVFVSQGIISGSDRDFLSERINETLDEQYSRNLSRYVSSGLALKAESGLHVGPCPLGYRSQLISAGPERKVPDPATMPALILVLKDYSSGEFSYRDVANHANAAGYRMQTGALFTGYCIRDIMSNRFYEGKVVYHKGCLDEKVIDGCHEVPGEVEDLWLRCQAIKKNRTNGFAGHPRGEDHTYPFSKVLKCHKCGSAFHGEAGRYKDNCTLRLVHERRTEGRNCNTKPHSRQVDELIREFGQRVLAYVHLDNGWQAPIIERLRCEAEVKGDQQREARIIKAMENLRKQHLWGDITDEDYRRERAILERDLKIAAPDLRPVELPNLERAAELLNNLSALWSHPGVTNTQRESLIQEVFSKITVDGKGLASIEPKPVYAPLFSVMLDKNFNGYCETEQS